MRKSGRWSIAFSGVCLLAGALGFQAYCLDGGCAPALNFDLTPFKLQTLNTSLAYVEVTAAQLVAGFTSSYFYTDSTDGAMVFRVPSNGATTSGSDYPRCELRQMTQGADWLLTDTTLHCMTGSCKVTGVATAKPVIAFAQVHGSDNSSTLCQIRWNGYQAGNCSIEIFFQNNGSSRNASVTTLIDGLTLGTTVSYVLTMKRGVVNVTVNGASMSQTYTTQYYGTTDHYYFKAGNYFQYSSSSSVYGIVKYYSIALGVPTAAQGPATHVLQSQKTSGIAKRVTALSKADEISSQGRQALFRVDGRLVRRVSGRGMANLSTAGFFLEK